MRDKEIGLGHPPVCIAETLTGGRGLVDLWYYFHESIDDAALFARQEALLTPDERDRHQRYHFERDRRLFLATRALVRTVLSSYAPVHPGEWRFDIGSHGKPFIKHPAITPPLFFNLTNTPGLVACAVSVAHEMIGVDVERLDRKSDLFGLADRFFSPAEVKALRALPSAEQSRRFFEYWTLKESYIKARGLGLALPLNQFSFLLDQEDIGVAFDERLADGPARWRFELLSAPPNFMVAVGVDTGGATLSLRTRQIVPLRE